MEFLSLLVVRDPRMLDELNSLITTFTVHVLTCSV
jgi:hypothetical protein